MNRQPFIDALDEFAAAIDHLRAAATKAARAAAELDNPLSDRDLATTLGALRYWQIRLTTIGPSADVELNNIFTNGGTVEPLNSDEIDALCDRLNGGHGS